MTVLQIQNNIIDRDLSWLSFNQRILDEAKDQSLPVYERIKFLAIYSANLDEFFRVRVAAIRSLAGLGRKKIKKQLDFDPKLLLSQILEEVNIQLNEYGAVFRDQVIPALQDNHVVLYYQKKPLQSHRAEITRIFKNKVLSYIQPHFFQKKSSKKLFLENYGLYLIVELQRNDPSGEITYAHVQVPSGNLPRFFPLTPVRGKNYLIFLDDIIRENLRFIFPEYQVLRCHAVKLNRDQDVSLEKKISEDIVKRVKKQLEKRKVGIPTRFLYDLDMPKHMLTLLVKTLGLKTKDLVPGGRYHNMNDLMKLPNPKAPLLTGTKLSPVLLKKLDTATCLFDVIEEKDQMLHFPYQSYDYILRFFNEAAIDPKVTEVRATLYRVAAHSLVAQALISAAKNGKKVAVFVELKARFDEANNIQWAEKMVAAGVKVTYSFEKLKVHAKVALVKRKIANGKTKRYAFFGTGNFNENTAGVYADHGLLTAHNGMTKELNQVFDYLQKGTDLKLPLKHLLVARFNMTAQLVRRIDREIAHVKQGKKGYIMIKLNNLEEENMIMKLYEAGQAGVKIDLIIRGICRLRPQSEGLSENIRAIRIVDSYLEHARIFKFHNDGQEEVFLGSADWMNRNLHHRIEVNFPIYDENALEEINQLLSLQLADNTKARLLDDQLHHHFIEKPGKPVRSQVAFHNYLKGKG